MHQMPFWGQLSKYSSREWFRKDGFAHTNLKILEKCEKAMEQRHDIAALELDKITQRKLGWDLESFSWF